MGVRQPREQKIYYNIDRVNRICTKCDNITIGDEYHYIMECEHFSNFRNRFIVTNLRERSNILKFKQLFSQHKSKLYIYCLLSLSSQSIIFILINHIQWYREDINIHIANTE
jgi:hypothetical protein